MFKILTMLIPFLKEMIFGKKGESINDTLSVSARKWLLLIIIISSLLFNLILGKRVYTLSMRLIDNQKEMLAYKDIKNILDTEKQKNFILNEYLMSCYRNAKGTIPDKISDIKNNSKAPSIE